VRSPLVAWIAVLALASIASACTKAAPSAAETQYRRAFAGLCLARDQAGQDRSLVAQTFFDRSHDTLHALARAVAIVDRVRAARLLQAKNVVETELRAGPPPASVGADLDRLIAETRAAMTRLGDNAPSCGR
jgi:hypothetical protein